MREPLNPILKLARIRSGLYASTDNYGPNGAFSFRGPQHRYLTVIASDRKGWEHVSVSVTESYDVPTWEEMCYVKELFWTDDEWVVQYHPAKVDYINVHLGTLHLWKPTQVSLPTPPSEMV